MITKGGFVYLLASHKQGTLYLGVTARFVERMAEHRHEDVAGFSRDYGVKRLVWWEQHGEIESAIRREKLIKGWNRQWKINLIDEANAEWDDLAVAMFGFDPLPAYDKEATSDQRRLSRNARTNQPRHSREGGTLKSPNAVFGQGPSVPNLVTLGSRLRGNDESE